MTPQLFHAQVMHKRLFPKVNAFTYRIYYLALPLDRLHEAALAVNRPGLIAFRERDHGPRDGSPLAEWIAAILRDYGLATLTQQVVLIAMPRVAGYGFNPVSFWLCLDAAGDLRAVLAEVHNTFGEAHSYLCAHLDRRPIAADDWLVAEKIFHVSPFLPREGSYLFRFAWKKQRLGIWIDYHDAQGHKQLLTSLIGRLEPLTGPKLRRAALALPLAGLRAMALIHWQAVRLKLKGIRYWVKPLQRNEKLSVTHKLNKL